MTDKQIIMKTGELRICVSHHRGTSFENRESKEVNQFQSVVFTVQYCPQGKR